MYLNLDFRTWILISPTTRVKTKISSGSWSSPTLTWFRSGYLIHRSGKKWTPLQLRSLNPALKFLLAGDTRQPNHAGYSWFQRGAACPVSVYRPEKWTLRLWCQAVSSNLPIPTSRFMTHSHQVPGITFLLDWFRTDSSCGLLALLAIRNLTLPIGRMVEWCKYHCRWRPRPSHSTTNHCWTTQNSKKASLRWFLRLKEIIANWKQVKRTIAHLYRVPTVSFFVFDSGGNVTFINEYAQKFFGFAEEEILGKNLIGTIVPEFASKRRKSHFKDQWSLYKS